MRSNQGNHRVSEAAVNTRLIRDLLSESSEIYLVLTHPAVVGEMLFSLHENIQLVYSQSPDFTVDQWLESLGNLALPTTDTVPEVITALVKSRDVLLAAWDVSRVHPTSGEGTEYPDEELRNLKLTKENMDYQLAFEHALVTVNGYFHLTDYNENGLFIAEGGRTLHVSNRNNIGMLSFADIGKVSMVPITPEMILSRNDQPLKEGFILNMTGYDIQNKVVMMSIGGYLHFDGHHYRVIGENSIKVEWWKIPFPQRYMQSKKVIDLSSVDAAMERNANHGDALDLNEGTSDEAIVAYMTMSQSFVILVESDGLFFEREGLEMTGLPGRYVSYKEPEGPVQLDNGLFPEYTPIRETDAYIVAVDSNFVNRYANDTRPYDDDNYYHPARISNRPKMYCGGYLLNIGYDRLSYE